MKIKIWDKPIRIFHWLLVSAYIGAFFTSENEWLLEYHTVAGYIALGLVCFRILWGFTGTHYARFSEFIKGWSDVKSYIVQALKLSPPRYLGHNPAVGWVVIFMLILTAGIIATGIITYSGEENMGIWAGLFSFEAAAYARKAHQILAYSAVAMIVIHICAALFHDFVFKENIILSMITGMKEDEAPRIAHRRAGRGLSAARLVVWIFAAIMGGIALIYLPPEGKTDFSSKQGFVVVLKPNETWVSECASCHNAFHPTLLPAASWKRLMDGLEDHYGENVSLDDNTRKEVLDYLVSSSAENSATEASRKILHSIARGDAPIRITDMAYWKWKHSEIAEDVFKRKTISGKSNCVACHPGAEIGSFEDRDIGIPK